MRRIVRPQARPHVDHPTMHVYNRTISTERRTSLSVIADLIQAGGRVLDLGMGSGALGAHLQSLRAVVIDGVTLNPEEADLARSNYRHTFVADLENVVLGDLLQGERYDYVVCADVFEHLRQPERLLAQLPDLLHEGGRLLSSVPNAAYCGLIAELMQGEFRYRDEGLLDRTHLRFFTLHSLLDWYTDHGWQVELTERIELPLTDSEFRPHVETLPPGVASHLVSGPEALTYQFVMQVAPPGAAHLAGTNEVLRQLPAAADFVLQLYWEGPEGGDETQKHVRRAALGLNPQTVEFELPQAETPLHGLWLDPSDRQGFLHLFRIELLRADNTMAWCWPSDGTPADVTLRHWSTHDVTLTQLWQTSPAVLLLVHGDDPQIRLPLDVDQLHALQLAGGRLRVTLGWPMSGDFILMARETQHLEHDRQLLRKQVQQLQGTTTETQADNHTLRQRLASSETTLKQTHSDLGESEAHRLRLEHELTALKQHLTWIEQSTIFRATRPLVKLKMAIDRWRRPGTSTPQAAWLGTARQAPPGSPVDVIVPVYRGLDDTRQCLEAVMANPCRTPLRLIVINDCSPEPALVAWLEDFQSRHPNTVLLHNATNLGFVGTVNRGMSHSDAHDVVLLNSDAEVHGDWLDRLQACAYCEGRIASVTPFSNNATICSYPRFCETNPLPADQSLASMDRLCATLLAGQAVELPTGHGFCMYIRRAALQDVGLFDVEQFGKGYGEENDFSMRALQKGWKHLHALDVFVRHAGGVSFGAGKSEGELRAIATLRRLHPDYETLVHRFIATDPASKARLILDIGRVLCSDKTVVLNVTHNRDGGTLRHQDELAHLLHERAVFLMLSPLPGGVALGYAGRNEGMHLSFSLPAQFDLLLELLRTLRVAHVHYHHLLGHQDAVYRLAALLGVTHDFTAHDYFSYCPQISLTDHSNTYCGEKGLDQCRRCLSHQPAPGGLTIEAWHGRHLPLLSHARHVICPTPSTAQRLHNRAPLAPLVVAPHPDVDPTQLPDASARVLPADRPLKIVVLGALSTIKGADLLEAVSQLAARRQAPVEFHLLGYAYRHLATQPRARLTVHGRYNDNELPELLAWLQPDLVWFPAQWPETYSYTLSACLASGLPVLAPRLGAFADRLAGRPWSWLANWDQPPEQWLEQMLQIRERHFLTGAGPTPPDTTVTVSATTNWSYPADYLLGLPQTAAQPADAIRALADTCWPLSGKPKDTTPASRMLRVLQHLRTSPCLAWLARRIPTGTQRRVKNWLTSQGE